MPHPRRISAQFEIVTPMFLGDAKQKATRISEASIKGALVFWWRALNYGRLVLEAKGDQSAALAKLHSREQFLFGGGEGGQSRVLLKVSHQNITKTIESGVVLPGVNNGDGVPYLGYGLMNYTGVLTRSCFIGGSFSVDLIIRQGRSTSEDIQDEIVDSILPALKLLGLIGGLGSRVRRGWGSVALINLLVDGKASWRRPDSIASYKAALTEVIGDTRNLPTGRNFGLTAFAKETDIRCNKNSGSGPLGCLSDIARGLQRYRSWGQTGNDGVAKVNHQPSEMNFRADHDWFKDKNRPVNGEFTDSTGNVHLTASLPKRAAFGLPHNYFSKGFGKMDVSAAQADRRASPLMFHIHQLATGQCFTVASFFPTKFLDDDRISINGRGKDFAFDLNTILNFLDNKRPDGTRPPNGDYFPNTPVFS